MINKEKAFRLSQSDMVLVSLYRVSNAKKDKIPFEEIAIQAWKDFPNAFSLKNHPEFPDGSAIPKRVADNLRPNGLVISLGNSYFRLTDKGLFRAQKLDNRLRGTAHSLAESLRSFSREQEKFLKHALNSTAFDFWLNGKEDEIIDHDVKLLFRFSTGTKVSDRKVKLDFALEAIEKAKEMGFENISKLSEFIIFLIEKFDYMFKEGEE